MKSEYDFKNAQRGKFFRTAASLELPVYLESGVRAYMTERANAKSVSVSDLVNDLLKRDIDLIEASRSPCLGRARRIPPPLWSARCNARRPDPARRTVASSKCA
jgi:hypothetical protein